jgi:hypothetical protein
MDKLNQFFLKLYSNPSLLWKLGASLVFISFAAAVWIVPSITAGISESNRHIFAALLVFYAIFRFYTFYNEFRQVDNER